MEMIMNNWVLAVAFVAVLVYIGIGVYAFVSRPRAEQIEDIKEWLIWAVKKAEDELGGGSGPLKLRMVYDMFVTRFPTAARFIGFNAFSDLVDDALDSARVWLEGDYNADRH